MNEQHKWTVEDDLLAFYLQRYGAAKLPYSEELIAVRLRLSDASLSRRKRNFKYLSGDSHGLANFAKQSQQVYERYKSSLEPKLRSRVIRSIDAIIELRAVPDSEAEDISAREGALSACSHLRHERSRRIIAAKRRRVMRTTGRVACEACAFDFQQFYGNIGVGFCEVHHLRPLGKANQEVTTKLDDLAVVCSNCHRMLHRSHPFLTIKQLKVLVQSSPNKATQRADSTSR